MSSFRMIKNKMRLIYTSRLTFYVLILQIFFLLISMYAGNSGSVEAYTRLLRNDLVLWLMFVPLLLAEHRVCIFTTYYSYLSRICKKGRMVLIDYMTMAISTCVSAAFVLLIPFFICFSFHEEGTQSGNVYVIMAFLFVRYVLIGLLVQCAAYSIVYSFAIFQKRGESVCAVPFFLYPLFMLPMEFLSANGKYISLLDFSAGRYYTFAAEGSTVVNSVLHYNAHLLVYLGFYIFISVRFLAGRWEFSEGGG